MDINNLWSEYDLNSKKQNTRCLAVNTILEGKYLVGPVLGQGGFGITYVGYDLNMETKIAIKEYFPVELVSRDTTTMHGDRVLSLSGEKSVTYKAGLKKYVAEAQNVSQFSEIPGVVSVKDFFYANETAYIVMEYIDGISLKDYLKEKGGSLSEEETLKIMKPVLEALVQVHQSSIIHRDISPDNIMLTFEEGSGHDKIKSVKLIDFGAARMTAKNDQKSLTIILKHGYAPEEQYRTHGEQGTWTDVYALCAVLYRMLTGETPVPAMDRMFQDELKTFDKLNTKVSANTAAAILKGLAVKKDDRIQNVQELIDALYKGAKVKAAAGSGKFTKNKMGFYAGIGVAVLTVCIVGGIKGKSSLTQGTGTADVSFGQGEMLFDTGTQDEEAGEQIAFYHPQRSISSSDHVLMCLPDGTVKAFGMNDYGQCNVSEWENVVRVAATGFGSIGVCKDGTVLYAGSDYNGYNLELWMDIVDVQSVDLIGILGLKKDGTIEISRGNLQYTMDSQEMMDAEISQWTDMKAIVSRYAKVFGLKNDGTVIGIDEEGNKYQLEGWEDVECIDIYDSTYGQALIGICNDGTVKTRSLASYVEFSTAAKELERYIAGVKVAQIYDELIVTQDGKVIFADDRDQMKERAEMVGSWSDIVAAGPSSSRYDTYYYGIKSDGTIVSSMTNKGNAELEDFENLEWVQIALEDDRISESIIGYTKDGKLLVYGSSEKLYQTVPLVSEDAYSITQKMWYESDYDRTVAWYQDPEIYAQLCRDAGKIKQFDSDRTFLRSVLVTKDGDAAFYNGYLENSVYFSDVKQIPKNFDHMIVKTDGTVRLVDDGIDDNLDESRDSYVEGWTDIDYVIGCQNWAYGVKTDGSIVTSEEYGQEEYPVMKKVVTNEFVALGITEDDKVHIVVTDRDHEEKGMLQVEGWTDVEDLAIGDGHTVALLKDGTVKAVGQNHAGQCDVEGWTDIEKIYVGNQCTLGINKNGDLLMAGMVY